MNITVSNETILVLVKFRIWGNLRFLSHAETVKVFQRACVRAGVKVAHSHGFNPRPRLSLPLPRSVGVETDDDLLCLRVEGFEPADSQPGSTVLPFDTEHFTACLSAQLPEGCQLISVSIAKTRISFQPSMATYVLVIRPQVSSSVLKTTIEHLLASESLNIQRRIDDKGNMRNVDVRPFLNSIEVFDSSIVVECRITPAGSIRVEEILKLLQLNVEDLAAPIKRTHIQWEEYTANN